MSRTYLFDGTNTDMWVNICDGQPIDWIVEDGIMTVNHHDIRTNFTFGDAHIHVEWREPDMPNESGQGKGNSGVYIQGCYELQVLDSYGLESKNNDCGAIYEMYAPRVNACKPALEWQTYDIYLRAARLNEDGSVKEFARATIFQNDILIQNNIELFRTTPGNLFNNQPQAEGPLFLQDHGNPVSYRNIWVETL